VSRVGSSMDMESGGWVDNHIFIHSCHSSRKYRHDVHVWTLLPQNPCRGASLAPRLPRSAWLVTSSPSFRCVLICKTHVVAFTDRRRVVECVVEGART